MKGSRNGYLFSLPCRDSATATALRFFHRVILSVVEIRAKRGSNGTKCHSGSRWKKFDSLRSLRMTRQGWFLARWVSHFVIISRRGKFAISNGKFNPPLILFPKIIFSQASMSYILGNLLTFHPKFAILYSLHESHNFHEEFAFLLMVKMHTPFSAFSYESSEDLCSNNWRCVFRALQLGRTFSLYKFEKEI